MAIVAVYDGAAKTTQQMSEGQQRACLWVNVRPLFVFAPRARVPNTNWFLVDWRTARASLSLPHVARFYACPPPANTAYRAVQGWNAL